MKIIDCYWERDILGCRVAEVIIETSDVLSEKDLNQIEDYDYVVVKVPMHQVDNNYFLSKKGFALVEVQCKLSKTYKSFDFDDKLIKYLYSDVSFSEIVDRNDFNTLLESITPNMFSTDRITLDPVFGKEKGCLRYKHWMKDAYENDQANFMSILYKNEPVGFSMYKNNDGVIDGILGGIFVKYQSYGIGMLTPTRHFLNAKKSNTPFKKLSTSISSNNEPVWRFYNYLNFKIDQLYYVFIKHK